MTRLLRFHAVWAGALSLACASQALALDTNEPDPLLKLLGKYVFFDRISTPARMACASCHAPENGGTSDNAGINLHAVVITGADPHMAGTVKPPSNAYASMVAPFAPCNLGGLRLNGVRYCGGNFWDGRAEGVSPSLLPGATRHLGAEVLTGLAAPTAAAYARYFGPTADQALNPMPGAAEQNISRRNVCLHVANASYGELYLLAYGVPLDCSDSLAPDTVSDTPNERAYDLSFKRLMLAVAAWQSSSELNSFSSKRDLALRAELDCLNGSPSADPSVCSHPKYTGSPGTFPLVGLTDQENLGHDIFYNTAGPVAPPANPNVAAGNCVRCHASDASRPDGTSLVERYTDDAYHNIGTPLNTELPAAPSAGLEAHAGGSAPSLRGGVRTPTLRNVDKRRGVGFVKAYTHNGWFKSLESLVHFYNTSRVLPSCTGPVTESEALAQGCWPAPESPATVAPPFLVGALGMGAADEAALVAYLKTLTDAVTPTAPQPYRRTR